MRVACDVNGHGRPLLVVVLWTALLVASGGVSLFGECIAPPPPCEALRQSEVVFQGTVADTAWVVPDSLGGGNRVTFEVLRAFKGVTGKRFTGTFNANAEDFQFFQGQVVVVYARRFQGMWATACSRTTVGDDPARTVLTHALDRELSQLAACPQPTPGR